MGLYFLASLRLPLVLASRLSCWAVGGGDLIHLTKEMYAPEEEEVERGEQGKEPTMQRGRLSTHLPEPPASIL